LFLLGSIGRTLKNLPHRVRTEIGKEHQRKGGGRDLGGDMVAEEVTCLMEDDVVLMKGARLLLIEDHIGIASGDPKPTGTYPAGDWSEKNRTTALRCQGSAERCRVAAVGEIEPIQASFAASPK
jgi:hypothetical protein